MEGYGSLIGNLCCVLIRISQKIEDKTMLDVISGLIVCSDGVIVCSDCVIVCSDCVILKQISKLGTRYEVKNFSLRCVQVVTC